MLDKKIDSYICPPKAKASSKCSPKRVKNNRRKRFTPLQDQIGKIHNPPVVDIAAKTTVDLKSWEFFNTYIL